MKLHSTLFSLFVFGCGQYGSAVSLNSNENNLKVIRSVFMTRHCPRAPFQFPMTLYNTTGWPEYVQNYTTNVVPGNSFWGVEASECTTQGKQFANNVGQAMSAYIKEPVAFIADSTAKRDNTTAQEMAAGLLANNISSSMLYQDIFSYTNCADGISNDTTAHRSFTENLKSYPVPANFNDSLAKVVHVMNTPSGEQVNNTNVTNIKGLPNEWTGVTSWAFWAGKVNSFATLAESWLSQRMSGLISAWDLLNDEELIALAAVNNYAINVIYGSGYLAKRFNSEVLNDMTGALSGKTKDENGEPVNGTRIYVGHDLNLAGIFHMLSMETNDPVFGANSTTPISRLAFILVEDVNTQEQYVKAATYGVDFDGLETTGDEGSPALINGEKLVKLSEFIHL
eukprot:Pgem_evm1s20269